MSFSWFCPDEYSNHDDAHLNIQHYHESRKKIFKICKIYSELFFFSKNVFQICEEESANLVAVDVQPKRMLAFRSCQAGLA